MPSEFDPIIGGIGITPLRFVDGIYDGTLGAIVLDNATLKDYDNATPLGYLAPLLLSNYHVLCVNEGWKEEGFGKSKKIRLSSGKTIAEIMRGTWNENMDAAVARLNFKEDYVASIRNIGPITGIAEPIQGMKVRKQGYKTGLTYGTILALQNSEKKDWVAKVPAAHGRRALGITGVIPIEVDETRSDGPFALQGDSGAVIVDEKNRAVGLLIAIEDEHDEKIGGKEKHFREGAKAFAIPISRVLEALKVKIALQGIGGYDLTSENDQVLAFDYEGFQHRKDENAFTGGKKRPNDLVLYRPGKGIIFIVQRDGETKTSPDHIIPMFQAVYKGAEGIACYGNGNKRFSYDLKSGHDRVFAFDFEGLGYLDDLVLYRPGEGGIFILKRSGFEQDEKRNATTIPKFEVVYKHETDGISGRDFTSEQARDGKPENQLPLATYDIYDGQYRDQGFAFDYDGTGKLNDLVFYRPGQGAIFIFERNNFEQDNSTPKYKVVYKQGDPGKGIGDVPLNSDQDRLFAFDYEGDSKLNDLVCYRSGAGAITILQRNDDLGQKLKKSSPYYHPVYKEPDGGKGLGGIQLASKQDQLFAFDHEGDGNLDDLVVYRPGEGIVGGVFILQRNGFEQDEKGKATTIPHFDVVDVTTDGIDNLYPGSPADRAFAFDYEGDGKLDDLVFYRPGKGAIKILQRNHFDPDKQILHFNSVYSARVTDESGIVYDDPFNNK